MSETLSTRQQALAIADLAAERKAQDITIIDIAERSSVADYFIICTGRSHIQVDAICARIEEGMRDRSAKRPLSTEGLENGLWALLDYGDIVVHVFQQQFRALYDLERLWGQSPRWNYEDGSAKKTASGSQ